MSALGLDRNEYGTLVSVHLCNRCGNRFTVCPPVVDEEWGGECLAEGCASYDLRRDIDLVWEHTDVIITKGGSDAD